MILNLSLQKLRVLNTRPLDQGKALSETIRRAGGIAIDFPTLAIQPTPVTWLELLPPLVTLEHAIFISSNAVHYFFTALKSHSMVWPQTIQNTAIGQATAEAVKNHHLHVYGIPEEANSEHIIQLKYLQNIHEKNILLIKGEGGRELLAQTLKARGAHLITLAVYRRELPPINTQAIQAIWQENAIDIILITSEESMRNLFILMGHAAQSWLCDQYFLVISDRLAQAAKALGVKNVMISRYDKIIETLAHVKQGMYL